MLRPTANPHLHPRSWHSALIRLSSFSVILVRKTMLVLLVVKLGYNTVKIRTIIFDGIDWFGSNLFQGFEGTRNRFANFLVTPQILYFVHRQARRKVEVTSSICPSRFQLEHIVIMKRIEFTADFRTRVQLGQCIEKFVIITKSAIF